MAPYRFGFTATLPDYKKEQERRLTMEALVGPVIGEITMDEAIEQEMIAKPKVKIIKFDFDRDLHNYKRYADVYHYGVIDNLRKNRRIMHVASQYLKEGKTVLVVVVNVEHGQRLKQIGRDLFQMNCEFVYGETDPNIRENVKEFLNSGEIPCVITNVVWREGIDIPKLDVVINAGGGKGEIQTLQTIGRGLRKVPGKEETIIIDFFDPSHTFLIAHFGERFCLYSEQDWV